LIEILPNNSKMGGNPMAEADKELQKAVDDHLKRLYEQYNSNNKAFTATHIGHLSLLKWNDGGVANSSAH